MSKPVVLSLLLGGALLFFLSPWKPWRSSDGALEVTASSFQSEVLDVSKPVLAYFWKPA